jgi:hypothetical protein
MTFCLWSNMFNVFWGKTTSFDIKIIHTTISFYYKDSIGYFMFVKEHEMKLLSKLLNIILISKNTSNRILIILTV